MSDEKDPKCPLHQPGMSCEPVRIEVPIGDTTQDFQIGNFINAVDHLVCTFANFMTSPQEEMLPEALRLYADHLEHQ